MKTKIIRYQILTSALTVTLSACGYYNESTLKPGAGQAPFGNGATLGFEIVKTILTRNACFNCHTAERGNRGGVNLESFASGKPLAARIASTTASGFMPLGGPRVSADDVTILRAWADAGAPETSTLPLPGANTPAEEPTPVPAPTPVPGAVDFAQVRAAIFNPHCVGCHAGFAEYARVAARLPAIQRAIDTNFMPRGGPPLSAELKTLLNEWIGQSAPSKMMTRATATMTVNSKTIESQ